MSDRRTQFDPDEDFGDDETFDARGDSRRGPLLLTTAFAVFILFVAVVWSAYQQGVRDRDEPPRILADAEPYRERPADPGGTQTPDLDIDAYDRISGEDTGGENTTPRAGPEEPAGRPGLRLEETTPDQTGNDAAPEREAPAEAERVETATPPPAQAEERSTTPVRTEPEPREAEPEPDSAPPPATSNLAIPAPVSGGSWVVQIGSFRTEEEAEGAWVNFISRYSDIAAGSSPDIQSAEIEGRGTYHRLRVAAFAGRDEASAFCAALQDRGQDCYAARR
ncbi:SPOR domain-containing protein [Hyphobacterium sp.]|uniref:SPOR domain-containing protein n=1 Tax=Hyphobacterium sp. TaxID=2004662 RepID=UPI003BAD2802